MFTIFCKIVGSSDPEADNTKSKPNSGALHTYADLVSKRVGAPAPRFWGRHVNFMYYIGKSQFFQDLRLNLRTFFRFILIQLRILIAMTSPHQEQSQHVVAFRV